jgi:gas vesicle protein
MRNNPYAGFLGTLLAGILIGTGIGILFAPQSGRRTRKDIERWGRKTKDLMWDFQENLKENLTDLIEEITEVTRENLDKGREITEDKKKKVLEVIEIGEKVLSDQKERMEGLFRKNLKLKK